MRIMLWISLLVIACYIAYANCVGFFPRPPPLPSNDFFNAAIGEKGEKGDPGFPGVAGVVGDPGLRGAPGPAGSAGTNRGGLVYTRWGRTVCPNSYGTELVYTGTVGGTNHLEKGGGANYLCMPQVPEYQLPFSPGVNGFAQINGLEYHADQSINSHNHNTPCAVCYVATREVMLMIPAKATCPPSWTREYYGYLMTEWIGSKGRSTFECVDKDFEVIPGSGADTDGALFVNVEATCNGLPCPPYDTQKELNCVVCTR